jgi:UDP-3-O-[3-hydroxymyristoyl] glucosamine N-acyltransferase
MAALKELAELVGGTVVGEGNPEIAALAPLDQARAGTISFLANPKYLPMLKECQASAVLVGPGVEGPPGLLLVVCANPYLAFAKVLTYLHARRPAPLGVLAGAQVDPSATLGAGVTIHPGCVVGRNVQIGDGTILYPGVVLYDAVTIGNECTLHAGAVVREQCRIGNRVILQPNAVIGSDGFGFAPDGESYYKIPQIGIVVVEDDVEIGAAACIDRAALGVTRIARGCKLDNLVHIAHNVVIGEDTVITAQVGIAGSAKVGRHCTFGGQSAVAGHIAIGDGLTFGGRTGVTGSLTGSPGEIYSGLPAIPHKEWLKASMSFNKLPEMRKDLARLRRQLDDLEKQLKEK